MYTEFWNFSANRAQNHSGMFDAVTIYSIWPYMVMNLNMMGPQKAYALYIQPHVSDCGLAAASCEPMVGVN